MLNKWIMVFIITLSFISQGWAGEKVADQTSPYQMVEDITVGILGIIAQHKEQPEADPEAFFNALDLLLEDVVDFHFIAKNVMGPYGKKASDEQRERFQTIFKTDLVETYGRGLLAYGDQEILLLPSNEDLSGKRRVTVYQEIHSGGKTYPLNYSLGLNKKGHWKVTNLVINGINLGKTFRNQFLQRAKQFDGDINKVIDNWAVNDQA